MRKPGKTIEVRVEGSGPSAQMTLRINDSNVPGAVPFRIEDESSITQSIERFEYAGGTQSDTPDAPYPTTYHERELALGRRLGRSLFGKEDAWTPLHAELDRCLCGLEPGEFVRILLWFDNSDWARLPWELALWEHPTRDTLLCLGHDRRVTLTRLDRGHSDLVRRNIVGEDQVLSLLNAGMHDSKIGRPQYDLTRMFLGWLGRHLPSIHVVSASLEDDGHGVPELVRHWSDSVRLTGRYPRTDIVHWHGHGSRAGVEGINIAGEDILLDADELVRRTEGTFLYVVNSCDSGGESPAGHPNFSSALLDAGAPVVLGFYSTVGQGEFPELPVLYVRLLQGWPLDECVQYLRRLFALKNQDSKTLTRERWHKLALRTVSPWYLDGIAARMARACAPKTAISAVFALERFDALHAASRTRPVQDAYHAYAGVGNNALVSWVIPDGSVSAEEAGREEPLPSPPGQTESSEQDATEDGSRTLLKRHYDAELLDAPIL